MSHPSGQIFWIVAPEVWVTANFKESRLADIEKVSRLRYIDAVSEASICAGMWIAFQLGSGSKVHGVPAENADRQLRQGGTARPVKIVIDSGLDPNIRCRLGYRTNHRDGAMSVEAAASDADATWKPATIHGSLRSPSRSQRSWKSSTRPS